MPYLVPIRRRRRGLGTACADMPPVSSTFQGPFNCEGNQSDVPRIDASGMPATQGDIDALWRQILSSTDAGSNAGSGSSFTSWINDNGKTILIGVGVLFGVLFIGRTLR